MSIFFSLDDIVVSIERWNKFDVLSPSCMFLEHLDRWNNKIRVMRQYHERRKGHSNEILKKERRFASIVDDFFNESMSFESA